jgi:elongation factor 1 alpha-like protein
MIEIETQKQLCVEKFSDFRQLGRFTLRSEGKTIAAGVVTEKL